MRPRRAARERIAESATERRTRPPMPAGTRLGRGWTACAGRRVEREPAPVGVSRSVGDGFRVVPRHVVKAGDALPAGVEGSFHVASRRNGADPQDLCVPVAAPQPTRPVLPGVAVARLCRFRAAVVRGRHHSLSRLLDCEGTYRRRRVTAVLPSRRRPPTPDPRRVSCSCPRPALVRAMLLMGSCTAAITTSPGRSRTRTTSSYRRDSLPSCP